MKIDFYNKTTDDYISFDVSHEDNVGEILYLKEREGYEIDSSMHISDKLDLYTRLSNYKIDKIQETISKSKLLD